MKSRTWIVPVVVWTSGSVRVVDELDEFLAEFGPKAAAVKVARKAKTFFRCSCGLESTDIVDVKGHGWLGHVFQQFNQKSWMGGD